MKKTAVLMRENGNTVDRNIHCAADAKCLHLDIVRRRREDDDHGDEACVVKPISERNENNVIVKLVGGTHYKHSSYDGNDVAGGGVGVRKVIGPVSILSGSAHPFTDNRSRSAAPSPPAQ
ncbi:hypothetical protein QTP88_017930 [Uroleucon formosanum]